MGTANKITTQIGAVVALVLGWIDPSNALNSSAQAALVAIAGAVVAVVHLVAAIESRETKKNGTAKPGNTTANGT